MRPCHHFFDDSTPAPWVCYTVVGPREWNREAPDPYDWAFRAWVPIFAEMESKHSLCVFWSFFNIIRKYKKI